MSNNNKMFCGLKAVGTILFVLCCSCIIVYSTSKIPLLERDIVNCIMIGKESKNIIFMFACMYILRAFFKLIRNHACAHMGNIVVNHFREKAMQRMMRQSSNQATTYQYTVLTNDLPVIADLLSSKTFVFMENLSILAFAIYNIGQICLSVSMVFVVGLSLLLWGSFSFISRLNPIVVKIKDEMIKMAASTKELVVLNKVIWAYDQQSTQKSSFRKHFDEIASLLKSQVKIDAFWRPNIDLLSRATFIASISVGAILVLLFDSDIGVLVLINSYAKVLTNVTVNMGEFIHFCANSYESLKRYHLLVNVSKIRTDYGSSNPKTSPKTVEFFADSIKNNGAVILENVHINLAKDEFVVIFGKSGMGKTVLADALAGIGNSHNIGVSFDGDLVTNKKQYWNILGYCQQKSCFFSNTIENNIALWKQDVDLRNLEDFCELDFVKNLPDGYDTIVSTDNPFLSGGERQRVCLARALSHKPDILILDDCLESIDVARRKRILLRLKEYTKNRIVVLLTSDEALCALADKVYLIESKTVVLAQGGEITYD